MMDMMPWGKTIVRSRDDNYRVCGKWLFDTAEEAERFVTECNAENGGQTYFIDDYRPLRGGK